MFPDAGNHLGSNPSAQEVQGLKLAGFQDDPAEVTAPAVPVKDDKAKDTSEVQEGQFVISEALPVVPAKIVKRIKKGEYVDMAELLKDNMEMERRRYLTEGRSNASFPHSQSRREVPDLLSWLHCFSMWAAVVSAEHPQKVRELWAYQATIIAEARRCGGRGWALYDSGFRQQISSISGTDFSKINQSLYSTTFLGFGNKPHCCPTCQMPDHTYDECALHPNRQLSVIRVREPTVRYRDEVRPKAEWIRKKPRSVNIIFVYALLGC